MRRWKIWIPLIVLVGVVALVTMRAQAGSGDGWLGVYIQDVDEDIADAEEMEAADGVLITRVINKSPAHEAGLKRGDIILKFDGKEARSTRRLTRMIDFSEPGDKKDVLIWRDGGEKKIVVEIGEDDDDDRFFSGDFDVHVPDIHIPRIDVRVPRAPRGHRSHRSPRAPSAPQVYDFSMGHLSSAYIGVNLVELSDQLADKYGVEGGALISEVMEDTPAEKAGLQAGDVIFEMDGRDVDDISDIREAIQDKDEDETIAVTVKRNGSEKTMDVGIAENQTWSGVGMPHFRSSPHRTYEWYFNDDDDDDDDVYIWRDNRDDHRDVRRDVRRDARREYRQQRRDWRSDRDEWREEWHQGWEEAMDALREELEELREELEDLEDGG